MIHTVREPKATGAGKSLTPTEIGPQFLFNGKEQIPHPSPGGHVSMDGEAFSVESGGPAKPDGGWLTARTLFPPPAEVERKKIGGRDHDFEVANVQYALADEGYKQANDRYTVGSTIGLLGWRVELRPKTPSRTVEFLHVMQAGVEGAKPESIVNATCQSTPESHVVTVRQGEQVFTLKLNREGAVGGSITINGGQANVAEPLPKAIEDHWRNYRADPSYKLWMTDPRYRAVIGPADAK